MDKMIREIVDMVQKRLTDADVRNNKVTKINGQVLNGITIAKPGESISPVIYIDPMLEKGLTLDAIVDRIINVYCTSEQPDVGSLVSIIEQYDSVEKNLSLQLLNKKWNRELLEAVPYREFLDLAIVVTVTFPTPTKAGKYAHIRVRKSMFQSWGKSFDEVFDAAYANLLHTEPELTLIGDFLDAVGLHLPEVDGDPLLPMAIFTNFEAYYGAVQIVRHDKMQDLVKQFDTDILVLPSSIHETILVPYAPDTILNDVNEIIREVNKEQLSPEEMLSDHWYIYKMDGTWFY